MKCLILGLILLLISLKIDVNAMGQNHMATQKLPKAELHLHLGGSFPLDYLLTIATPNQQLALKRDLEWISNRVPYHDGFKVFSLISQIVNSDDKLEKGTEALCRELERDGVIYAEIRTGLKDLGNGYEGYLQSVLRGMLKCKSDTFDARLLLSLQRASTHEQAKRTVDLALKYKDKGIVGIDISGDSTLGCIDTIMPELQRAKAQGLYLTLHLGESPKETAQKELLEILKPDRIGHGVFVSPDALDWILEHRIPIEICLSSSYLVQMTEGYALHPGLKLHSLGHPIAVCTDDPLIFSTTLSSELMLLKEYASYSYAEIEAIAESSLDYAFLSAEEKLNLKEKYFSFRRI